MQVLHSSGIRLSARRAVCQVRRWLPDRVLVSVSDSSDAALDFSHACQTLAGSVTIFTRLRLAAALYKFCPRLIEAGSLT